MHFLDDSELSGETVIYFFDHMATHNYGGQAYSECEARRGLVVFRPLLNIGN